MSDEKTCKDYLKGMPLPEVDFKTFLMSLSSSALVALGETEDPGTGRTEYMPHIAKHTIDIIAMLQQKFEQGLTDEESRLLCEMLYNLRMKYVNKSK
ncbi:protein of unknown function [Paucidesulfovibrio gracilis DSM 16080]|uniref:DUF1844 domain-containing protein n=1 Tax=Paucidesulfovibrio gracilis DSM 16080 TaxID=1121449 RepID=A0A1T4XJ57_9BACT|nr:DUF1844 domain-containing protein [Paucidesulfovibrio gracilis]SKA89516.1 protein of unknown function [Paucidesulfovibrio gracilis DSM 16080]